MPHCGNREQQDSTTFEMLHLMKDELRRTSISFHCLRKVNSKQRSSEQKYSRNQTASRTGKVVLMLDKQLRHIGTADYYGGFQTRIVEHLDSQH
ncbi:hypothetical protein STEG23_013405 [Scotinomys teguina]